MMRQNLNQTKGAVRFLLFLTCLVSTTVTARSATVAVPLTLDQITSQMEQAEQQRQNTLEGYTVTRKYVLQNARMQVPASMLVTVGYRKARGKTFQVMEENGAEGITKRVFQHLIQAESESSRGDNQQRGRVSTRNYQFTLLGAAVENGRKCYILELHPKAKTKYLFNGKVWVDADDFAVVKLEGRPAANVSFWVGKPLITQTWEKVGDFWMAASNRSHAESRLLGTSDLIVENSGYQLSPETIAMASSRKLCTRRGTAAGSTIN